MAQLCVPYRYGIWEFGDSVGVNATWYQPIEIGYTEISTARSGVTVDIAHHRGHGWGDGIIFQYPGVWRVNATVVIGGNIETGTQFAAWFGPYEAGGPMSMRASLPQPGYTTAMTETNGEIVTLNVDVLVEIATDLVGNSYTLSVYNGQSTIYFTPIVDHQKSVIEAHLLEDWTVV